MKIESEGFFSIFSIYNDSTNREIRTQTDKGLGIGNAYRSDY